LDILDERSILPDITSRTKEGFLRGMVHALSRVADQIPEDRLREILLERGSVGSTGIVEGVAIPHGKSKEVDQFLTSLRKSLPRIDFQSLDGKPGRLFFLLIDPENSAEMHLKILAQISRLMKDPPFRKRIMVGRSAEEIHAIFFEGGRKLEGSIRTTSNPQPSKQPTDELF
jgi:PTS system nitrogen regulatory IIA component